MINFCPDCGSELETTWNNCPSCGKPLRSHWNVCPYCSNPINRVKSVAVVKPSYKSYTVKPSPQVIYPKQEVRKKKKLTKKQKTAIIVVPIVLAAAILIPILSVFFYNYNHPKKTVQYYVNNGSYSRSYTVSTTRSKLDYYKDQPHPSHSYIDPDYVASIIESYCTPYDELVIEIAQSIRSQCVDPNDPEEVINGLLSFTQAIGYKSEIRDLAKYPLETIFNQGDCEDMSVLFGSLVVSLGYDAIITIIELYDEGNAEWLGHACIGVYLDFIPTAHWSYPPSYYFNVSENYNEYWICETTYQGWMIGELPVSDPGYFLLAGYAFIA